MFKKGQQKPTGSGRKKGVKNKTSLPALEAYLAERNINPVQKILDLIPSLPGDVQLNAWKTLLSYCYTKPQPDDSGIDPHPVILDDNTPTEELLKMLQ